MLAKRTISSLVIIVVGIAFVIAGGRVFALGITLVIALAAWEYGRMFAQGGYHPSFPVLIAGSSLTTLFAANPESELLLLAFSLSVLAGIAYHVFQFSKHQDTGGMDLAATLAGLVFIGFLGSYLARLRCLPLGHFWIILAVAPAGISDIGAFFVGNWLGCHKIAPELSPNKTLEGYLGGVLTAALTGYAAGELFSLFAPSFTGSIGLQIGIIVGIFCPLGDLGKSLLKRQFGLKHTSNLIPGHGGVLDRIDTWLWAGVIGYYLITYFFI